MRGTGRTASRGQGSSCAATSRTAPSAGASCRRGRRPGCRASPKQRPSAPRSMIVGATSETPCQL
eukprot:9495148-Alexandrium_andersonii.AAC.1